MDRRRLTGYLLLALGMASAGSVVVAARAIALGGLPPFSAACLRYLLAALVLVPWALARDGLPAWPGPRDSALLLLQAAAGSLGFSVLLLLGVERTTGAEAGVVAGFLPAAVALLAVVLLRERPGPRLLLALALSLAGLVLLNGTAAAPAGNLLVLGAVFGEVVFVTANKLLRRPLPAVTVSALMCLLGFLFTVGPALAELPVAAPPTQVWWAIAYHAAVPTVLGFVFWYAGAARVSGVEAGLFTAVMPLAGVGLSALVLGETLSSGQSAAAVLVVAGILAGITPSARRTGSVPRLP